MNNNRFLAFTGVSAMIFMLALVAGGCGSSSSVSTEGGGSAKSVRQLYSH